jgi:hypothetical protein
MDRMMMVLVDYEVETKSGARLRGRLEEPTDRDRIKVMWDIAVLHQRDNPVRIRLLGSRTG